MIVGPDGSAWVTEGGQNAIARVDPATRRGKAEATSQDRCNANLNTAAFDREGVLWFTEQNGVYGRLDPKTGAIAMFDALRGTDPYRIATTPDGQVFFASLASSYLGHIDVETALSSRWSRPCRAKARGAFAADSRGELWITGLEQRRSLPPRQQGQKLGSLGLAGRRPTPMPSTSTRTMWCGSTIRVDLLNQPLIQNTSQRSL